MRDLSKHHHKDDATLCKWLEVKLSKPPKKLGKNVPEPLMMDIDYISRYSKDWGFKISIDAGQNLVSKRYPIAICSLSPPGTLYQSFQEGQSLQPVPASNLDAFHTKSIDFKAEANAPVWYDGYHVRKDMLW